ncbi:MAG: ABC transporter permease [Chloroflexi bacterium]|nr:ABC transporter permease [Chloroflexota bacterium]MBU1746395.1 ABC transporter permease [Chloroflexota bacterium]
MLPFIGRRLVFIAFVCVVIVFFVHLGMLMVRNSEVTRPQYDLWGQGRVAWVLTRDFFANALKGDWGVVYERRGAIPVQDVLADTYAKSMGLLASALALATVVGLTLGTVAGFARRSRLTFPLLTATVLGISTPTFFAALILQVAEIRFFQETNIRLVYVSGFGWDIQHMLLPVLVLAARPVAYITRSTFLALHDILQEDYIRTAWAKGLPRRQVINPHALRNAAVPVLTSVGVSLRFALASLPIVEFFFAWPGLGARLLQAIRAGETQLVVVLALALGLTFLLVNLALDIAFRLVDPRLREAAT